MNSKKFCFIFCTNNELFESECRYYLERLVIPEGYSIEIKPIYDAKSMCEGYNRGMRKSDAKYKIYLHHDTFIIEKNFLKKILEIFEDDGIGMIGMVGSKYLPKDLIMWDGMRVGKVKSHVSYYSNEWSGNDNPNQKYTSVQCVDGFMMITQYDLPWREDLFTNWHFYDVSQGFEFRRAGYKVVVPYMQNSWCFHYAEIMNLTLYSEEKEIFRKEYEVELRKENSIVIFWGGQSSNLWNLELYQLAVNWKDKGYNVIICDFEVLLKRNQQEIVEVLEDIYGKNNVLFSLGMHDVYESINLCNLFPSQVFFDISINMPYKEHKFMTNFPDNMIYLSTNSKSINYVRRYYQNIQNVEYIPMAVASLENHYVESSRKWDVFWMVDYVNPEKWLQDYLQLFDGSMQLLVNDIYKYMEKYSQSGVNEALAYTLEKYKLEVSDQEFTDLCLAFSSLEDYRVYKKVHNLITLFVENGIEIHVAGDGWDNYIGDGNDCIKIEPIVLNIEVYAINSKFVINSLNTCELDLILQIEKTCSCGAIPILERTPGLEEYFNDNNDVIYFDNLEEIPSKIISLIKNYDEYREKHRNIKKILDNYFSIQNQAESILKIAENMGLVHNNTILQKGNMVYEPNNVEKNITVRRLIRNSINMDDLEIKDCISAMLRFRVLYPYNNFFIYPYFCAKDYNILYDADKEMPYVLYGGKAMYYPRNMSKEDIIITYRLCCMEQDPYSPHYYKKAGYEVREGDVVLEAGVAEGNFSLSIIDKVSKVYLIECEPAWIEALQYTFAPYKDKVEIVSKYLSDSDENGNITIDTLLQGGKLNFIKMDIEGAELSALKGAKETFAKSDDIRCAICTYHRHGDEENIRKYLEENGMECETSDGYMFFDSYDEEETEPEFRRGLIYGRK